MNKRPAYCPEWFYLDNYNVCEKYTRKEWGKAFSMRKVGLYNNILEDLSEGIDKNFLIDTLIYFSQNNERVNGDDFFDFSSISELDLSDFISIYASMKHTPSEMIKKIDSMFYQPLDGTEVNTSFEPFKDWQEVDLERTFGVDFDFFSPLTNHCPDIQRFVTVDLSNNDEKIIEDFKLFLQGERERKDTKNSHKRKRDKDIELIHKYNVLPYMDLYLWCIISGEKLTQYQMANLLFPDEHDVDIKDRLRMVTIPRAIEILESDIDLLV